jgi:hypothetical protein
MLLLSRLLSAFASLARLAERSLDALGWLAAFLADVSSRHGVSTPLMLTADRAGPCGRPPRRPPAVGTENFAIPGG